MTSRRRYSVARHVVVVFACVHAFSTITSIRLFLLSRRGSDGTKRAPLTGSRRNRDVSMITPLISNNNRVYTRARAKNNIYPAGRTADGRARNVCFVYLFIHFFIPRNVDTSIKPITKLYTSSLFVVVFTARNKFDLPAKTD